MRRGVLFSLALACAGTTASAGSLETLFAECASKNVSVENVRSNLSAAGWQALSETGRDTLISAMAVTAYFTSDPEGDALGDWFDDQKAFYSDIITKVQAGTEKPFDQIEAVFKEAPDGVVGEVTFIKTSTTSGTKVGKTCRIFVPVTMSFDAVADQLVAAFDNGYLEQSNKSKRRHLTKITWTNYDGTTVDVLKMNDISPRHKDVLAVSTILSFEVPKN